MIEPHYIFEHDAELKRLSEMVFVEGGTFRMGSEDDDDAFYWEKPAHDVYVDSFHIGKYPVTQAVCKAVMKGPSGFIGDDFPVEQVSWEDIQVFIEKLYAQTGIKYRLPTDAEWEYAAKGGQYFNHFPFKYAGSDKLNEVGWYDENSHRETKPVGLKSSNFLGIHDMSGNVWEWCSDKINYFEDYKNVIEQSKKDAKTDVLFNPTGVVKGSHRVYRGGSCDISPEFCRSTFRNNNTPTARGSEWGFRLAISSLQ